MKQPAKLSITVVTIVAAGWAAITSVTACGSSSNNSTNTSTDGGSSSGSSSGGSSSGSSSGGACTLKPAFANATSTECATCVQSGCCNEINSCLEDPGCLSLFNCLSDCYSNTDGSNCSTTACIAVTDAGAASISLFNNEDNCWEGCSKTSTTCATPCGGGGDDGGGDDGGSTSSGTDSGGGGTKDGGAGDAGSPSDAGPG